MEDRKFIRDQFEKYLDGHLSGDETRTLLRYLQSGKDGEFIQSLIEENLNHLTGSGLLQDELINQRLNQSHQFIKQQIINSSEQRKPILRSMWVKWLSVAAVLAIICFGLLFHNDLKTEPVITITTANGQIKNVVLPDESKVWLNGGTTIRYPAHFRGDRRSVSLINGQAFFEIVHNASKPFLVTAKSASVTVYGTSFDVKSFADDTNTSIRVKTGKVGVQENTQKLPVAMLLGTEAVMVNNQTHAIQKIRVDAADIGNWRDHKLSFTAEPFTDVLHAISRKYAVKIEVKNAALLKEKITLKLDNEPIETVMMALSLANDFKYTIHEKLVIVNK